MLLLLAHARAPRRGIGGGAVAEQTLERGARRCSIGSGDSGPAHAMVPVYTQLRPKSQVVPESTDSSAISSDGSAVSWPRRPGDQLIDRDAGAHRAARRHVGEEPRARVGVIVELTLTRWRRRHAVEAADHEQAIAKRLERLERRREFEARAFGRREPLRRDDAVGHVDGAEAQHRFRRGLRERGHRRHHRIEQRQRHGRAHAPQARCGARDASW